MYNCIITEICLQKLKIINWVAFSDYLFGNSYFGCFYLKN